MSTQQERVGSGETYTDRLGNEFVTATHEPYEAAPVVGSTGGFETRDGVVVVPSGALPYVDAAGGRVDTP